MGEIPPRFSCSESAQSRSRCGRAGVSGSAAAVRPAAAGAVSPGADLEARTWSAAAGRPSWPPSPRGAVEPRASPPKPPPHSRSVGSG